MAGDGAIYRVRAYGPSVIEEAAPAATFPAAGPSDAADAAARGNAEEHAARLRAAGRAVQIELDAWFPKLGAWKHLATIYRTGLGHWTRGDYTHPGIGGPFNASPVVITRLEGA